MSVILFGIIGYAIMVFTTLRPLEGPADSMQWRRVVFVRELPFVLAVWEVEPPLLVRHYNYKPEAGSL